MNFLKGLAVDINFDFPAVVLMFMVLAFVYVLIKVQRREDFDLADMLRDETGRASSVRMGAFVCLAISSWAIMYMLVKYQGVIDTWIFLGYMGIWSGAKAVEKAIDAWASTKGNWPPKRDGDPSREKE
jgi:hypothetical protein